jgi:hypothetical protein
MQQEKNAEIDFREIFRFVRFSTFATISATSGRPGENDAALRRAQHSGPQTAFRQESLSDYLLS